MRRPSTIGNEWLPILKRSNVRMQRAIINKSNVTPRFLSGFRDIEGGGNSTHSAKEDLYVSVVISGSWEPFVAF